MAAKFPPLTCSLSKTNPARPGRGRFLCRVGEVEPCSLPALRAGPNLAQLGPEAEPGLAMGLPSTAAHMDKPLRGTNHDPLFPALTGNFIPNALQSQI